MRRSSWIWVLLILLKLGLGSVMATPATIHQSQPTQQTLALPSCHDHANDSQSQSFDEDPSISPQAANPASHTPSTTNVDCHHCCAVGLGGHQTVCLSAAPAVHGERIQQDWLSVSLRPGLRPPIV